MSEACGAMNLLELREHFPDRFYAQCWFLGEAFMRALPSEGRYTIPPRRIVHIGRKPKQRAGLPSAVDLAHAFVVFPNDPIWDKYLWTSDSDQFGQQVYVGAHAGKFEIHRHIHLTERFGTPSWR